MNKLKTKLLHFSLLALAGTALGQDTGIIGPSPYDFTTETWMQPFAGDGFTWGGQFIGFCGID
ncbi:hypothetical protein N9478_03205 [Gammaproteobacteria bacterium]|nr:hypothetical protein [Gammaproteobacteria bacterium]